MEAGKLEPGAAGLSYLPGRDPENIMGRLRDKMDADLKLAGRSESTRSHYIGCVALFVKFHRRPPEEMGEREVRRFLLCLAEKRKLSVGRYLQYLGALKFLYGVTLGRPEVVAGIPWPKMKRRRPDVLTRDEVARVLEAAPTLYWCAFLTTAYAAGLRRMEVAALRASDIDSRSGLIRVACGKGGKPREVMLDPTLLTTLRAHWRHHRLPGPWLFPARARKGWADHPVHLGQASEAFREALLLAGIARRVTLHGLRHAFATHLLEDGVDLYTLQQLLGHDRIETTTRYTLVRTDRIRATPSPLAKLGA
jgi:site-specific recombinase XerD